MKLTRSFTLPEEDPVVPEHVVERITDWFPYTTKVDVKRKQRNGWKVLTTIQLEGDEDPSDLYTMIKAYADYDVRKRGESGRYRALVWRLMPGDIWERRRVSFPVHPEDDDDDEGEQSLEQSVEQMFQRRVWMDLFNAQQQFIGAMAEYNHRATDRVLEQSKQDSERLTPLSDVIHELVAPYRDGLRMKSDAIREVGELRVRQQLAEAKANESGKFWETFGPAIQVAAAQVQTRLTGGRSKARALPAASIARGGTPVVQRAVVQAAAAASPPSTPPSSPPSSSPPPSPTTAPAPMSLHELAAGLLHGLGADTMVRLSRMLDDEQASLLEAIATATDDDDSAEAVVALMQSLMANPTAVIGMQQVLHPDELTALQQVAVLATRYVEERAAGSSASDTVNPLPVSPPTGETSSPGPHGSTPAPNDVE